MAKEIKTLEVKNSEEESTIRFWAQFGWELKSSQRVYNKDTHMETRGDDVYQVTETVDFTKLVLERDKANPNYSRIVNLEDEYFEKRNSLPDSKPSVGTAYDSMEAWARATKPDLRTGGQKAIFFLLLIGGIALAVLFEMSLASYAIALQIVGIIMIILSFVTKSKFKKTKLSEALGGSSPEGLEALKAGYAAYERAHESELRAARDYDYTVSRLNDIIEELETLI